MGLSEREALVGEMERAVVKREGSNVKVGGGRWVEWVVLGAK